MLEITPIGGIGEIGMNMINFTDGQKSFLIDCGLSFPREGYLGIDAVIPNYEEFVRRFPETKTIFITHAHEDHIGGLTFLLEQYDNFTIYAPKYAVALIKAKLDRNKIKTNSDIKEIDYYKTIKLGEFSVEYLRVDHSIPDASALFIKNPEKNILYVSDFRFYGQHKKSFIKRIKELNKSDKIEILMSDSTSVLDRKDSVSVEEVYKEMTNQFKNAKERIFVALFSSNVERINQVIDLCNKFKKDLFISGANLKLHVSLAEKTGHITADTSCIKNDKEYQYSNRNKTVVLSTGSQAEKNSSIMRLSIGEHHYAEIEKDDLIIFSSSKIPGNEKPITEMINRLLEKGAEVVTYETAKVHTSGHANKAELTEFLGLVKAKYFIPVHGERIHLDAYTKLAIKSGVKKHNAFLLSTKKGIRFAGSEIQTFKTKPVERLYVDNFSKARIPDYVIDERRELALKGLIVLTIVTDANGKTQSPPYISSRGFAIHENMIFAIERVSQLLYEVSKTRKLTKKTYNHIHDLTSIAQKEFRKIFKIKPEVMVNIITFDNNLKA